MKLAQLDKTRAADSDGPHLHFVRGDLESQPSELPLEDVWDRHGSAAYALACALLGDEAAATQAVTRAMRDLARSTPGVLADEALRRLSHHVYLRSQELIGDTPRTLDLPPAMVWLEQVAPLQRACLALCLFGGHTHREAADLLDVPPVTVAELLIASLRELSGSPVGGGIDTLLHVLRR